MKKLYFIGLCLLQMIASDAFAQSIVTQRDSEKLIPISATSFPDYFPIAYGSDQGSYSKLFSIFAPAMEKVAKSGNYKIEYILNQNYTDAISSVRRGEVDVLLGMYYATKQYSGLEYIYPAVLNNPVYIMMLPHNIAKVSKPEDLKNLRGVYIKAEYFSDYMLSNFKNYHMQAEETALKAYEKLFTGEADYIAGSYYYNYAEICRQGLRDYVSFSKAPLWNMPMFIGVSKASRQHVKVSKILKKYAADNTFRQMISNTLKELVQKTERESQGVVPPMFVKKTAADEKTPADEQIQTTEPLLEETTETPADAQALVTENNTTE